MDILTFAITTNASGVYNGTVDVRSVKLLYGVEWVDGTLADGVDATLSVTDTPSGVDVTLLTLTNANDDAWHYPRLSESSTAGSALSTYTLPIVNGSLKLAVTNGGSVLAGSCLCYLLEV